MNWFTNLLIRSSETKSPSMPSTHGEIGDYKSTFEHAVKFSKDSGFHVDFSDWKDGDLLDKQGDFLESTYRKAGVKDPSKAAFQCLKWSHFLAPWFASHLECRAWPTLGQLWKDDKPVFNPSWDELRRWSDYGIQPTDLEGKQGINLHSWITIETGEIIEPTLLNSLAALNPEAYEDYLGATVWGRDPNVLNKHRYFPMAVGIEFAEAIGLKSCLPLIANNASELHQIQMIVIREIGQIP